MITSSRRVILFYWDCGYIFFNLEMKAVHFMRLYIRTLIIILLSGASISVSTAQSINYEVSPISSIEGMELPKLNNSALKQQYAAKAKPAPNKFAEARDVHIDIHETGTWEETRSGILVWRSKVKSPGAFTLNLGFTTFKLPPSAQLFIYNPQQTDVLGPFTRSDNETHLQLWTPIIEGDEVVIELQVRPEEVKDIHLVLSRINHDFKDITKSLSSGTCNLDVVCGAADGWGIVDNYRDIISAVGAYSYNGTDQCSGVLINNARNDCTPYFLTAEHCGISNGNAPSVVVYWNYQNSYCRQPGSGQSGSAGDGKRNKFNSGAFLRADLGYSDFALIELDDPIDTELDLFFAGWNIEKVLPDTSICIHHPGVEEKRISFEFNRLEWDPTGNDTTHLLVNDWDIGTTEGGSSGSPLFNTRKQIVGQLTGGLAACGNNEYDSYGWINWSWTGAGTSQTSLRPWLDPEFTGVTQINGRSCNYGLIADVSFFEVCGLTQDTVAMSLQADGLFDNVVTYEVSGLPDQLEGGFTFDQGQVNVPNQLIIRGLSNYNDGDFNFSVVVSDGSNEASTVIFVAHSNDIAPTPTGQSPDDGAEDVTLNPRLQVKRTQEVEFEFELSTDQDFDAVVLNTITDNYYLDVTNLDEGTLYYWRARTINLCGQSDWSPVYSFTTALDYCTTIHYTGPPVEIPSDSPTSVQADINFPYGVRVEDVNVNNINGTHSYVEDLIATLQFNGGEATLFSEICGDIENFNLGFDDASLLTSFPCPPTDGRIYKPHTPLNVFNAKFAGGIWTLDIEDTAFIDGGMLVGWSMEICFTNPALPVVIPKNHKIYNCNEQLTIDVFVDAQGEQDWLLIARTVGGNNLDIDYQPSNAHAQARTISVLDKSQLQLGANSLIIDLVSANGSQLLASSVVEVIVEDDIGKPSILFPEASAKIKPEKFDRLEWSSTFNGPYVVEVALDPRFENVVWSSEGSNATEVSVGQVLMNNIYYARVRLIAGDCESVSDIRIFELDDSVSTDNVDKETYRIYPNPFSESFNISTGDKRSFGVNIYNADGSVVYQTYIRNATPTVAVQPGVLPKGIYIVCLYDEKGIFNRTRMISLH